MTATGVCMVRYEEDNMNLHELSLLAAVDGLGESGHRRGQRHHNHHHHHYNEPTTDSTTNISINRQPAIQRHHPLDHLQGHYHHHHHHHHNFPTTDSTTERHLSSSIH